MVGLAQPDRKLLAGRNHLAIPRPFHRDEQAADTEYGYAEWINQLIIDEINWVPVHFYITRTPHDNPF